MGMSPRPSTRAVLYLRISDDPTGLAAGVDRQRAECLRRAEREGLQVVAEYVDNDRSAYSGKPRPRFDAMLHDAALDGFDTVIVWASDRLYRRVADLTRIADELTPHARIVAVMGGGDIDLTTAEGILRAQVMGSVGEFESRRKAERVSARAVQRAKEDRRMTASIRPIGWRWIDPCPGGAECRHPATCTEPGRRPRLGSRAGIEPDLAEAPVLADAYQLVADGGSVAAAARLFTDRGVPTRRGGKWSTSSLRNALLNPRNAGFVTHKGDVVAEAADGHRIVAVDLWQRVHTRLSDPDRRTAPGRPAGTVLSGIARCGRCGGPMNASNKWERNGTAKPVYVCAREHHLTRRRNLIDDPVLSLVRGWLIANVSEIARHAGSDAGPAQSRAAEEVVELTNRLDSLAELFAEGALDPADYAKSAGLIRERLADAKRRAVVSAGKPATARLLEANDVGAAFDRLAGDDDPEPLRLVLRELLDGVDVPPERGAAPLLRWSARIGTEPTTSA